MQLLKHDNEQNVGDLKKGDRILYLDDVTVSFDGFKATVHFSRK